MGLKRPYGSLSKDLKFIIFKKYRRFASQINLCVVDKDFCEDLVRTSALGVRSKASV